MKHKKITFSAALSAIALSAILAGCTAPQPAPLQQPQPVASGEKPQAPVEMETPLEEYRSDTETSYRAVGSAEDFSEDSARRMAFQSAQRQIADKIETLVRTVSENYAKTARVDARTSSQELTESLSRSVSEQRLSEIRQIKSKLYFMPTSGTYKAYVAVEMKRDRVKKLVMSAVSPAEIEQIGLSRDKFDSEKFSAAYKQAEAKEINAVRAGKGPLPQGAPAGNDLGL